MNVDFKVVGKAIALAIAVSVAYQWFESRYPSWNEEVRLNDGRVVKIKQRHDYRENYGTSQSWVTFSLPEMGGKQTWHEDLMPIYIGVHEGRVYVLGIPRGTRTFAGYRYPRNYIVPFRWNGDDFKRIPFNDAPVILLREENVYRCVPLERPSSISMDLKDRQWCPPDGDKGQFTKQIDLAAYRELAAAYGRLDGLTSSKEFSE